MRAILIDVVNETVREVEVDKTDELKSMYNLIGCSCVDRVRIDEHDDIWVDDEGLLCLTSESKFFTFRGTVLAGNGLVMGCNAEGESVEPRITVERVRSVVDFHTLAEVREMVE